MIRRILETGYRKTLGALWSLLLRTIVTAVGRWGVFQVLYVLAVIGLMAGFVSAIVLPVPNQGQIIYPNSGAQSIPETFIDAMVILLGGAGIYLTYISGRQTTRSRMVNLYLAFAILLILLSVTMGIYLVSAKGG